MRRVAHGVSFDQMRPGDDVTIVKREKFRLFFFKSVSCSFFRFLTCDEGVVIPGFLLLICVSDPRGRVELMRSDVGNNAAVIGW